MRKRKLGSVVAGFIATIAAFGFISCSDSSDSDSTGGANSPAAVLNNIVIGEELLISEKNNGAREALADLQSESADVSFHLASSSRGTICLYFLKYGLSKHPALQSKDDFGKVIEWGTFKNDAHSYGANTEKYLEDYWSDIKEKIDAFNMGKLSVNKTDDGKYVVAQVDPAQSFMHYIVLIPTEFGTYDIDFYGVEVMGPKPDVYYEQTRFTSKSDFSVKRFYFDVPSSMHSFADVKADIASLEAESLSSIFDFADKKMLGLQKISNTESVTYEESYTDFVYAAKKDKDGTNYGIFKNNGTMVLNSVHGYSVKYLQGTEDVTDDMRELYVNEKDSISCVCLKPDYVGADKDFKCIVELDIEFFDDRLESAKALEYELLTSNVITEGLSGAVNELSEIHGEFFAD